MKARWTGLVSAPVRTTLAYPPLSARDATCIKLLTMTISIASDDPEPVRLVSAQSEQAPSRIWTLLFCENEETCFDNSTNFEPFPHLI